MSESVNETAAFGNGCFWCWLLNHAEKFHERVHALGRSNKDDILFSHKAGFAPTTIASPIDQSACLKGAIEIKGVVYVHSDTDEFLVLYDSHFRAL